MEKRNASLSASGSTPGVGVIFHQRRMDLIFSVNGRRGFLWIVWSLLVWSSRCNPKRASNTLNIFFVVVGPVFSSCFDTSREKKGRCWQSWCVVSEAFIKEREREREREKERINEETR